MTRESVSPKGSEFVKPSQELVEENKGDVGLRGDPPSRNFDFRPWDLECPVEFLASPVAAVQQLPLLDLDLKVDVSANNLVSNSNRFRGMLDRVLS